MGNSTGFIALHDFNYLKIWHDISAPITSARLNLDLLLESKPKPVYKKYLKRALIGLQQIDSIVSRFPQPKSQKRREAFKAKPVIIETVKLFKSQLESLKVLTVVDIGADVLIIGDKSAFKSIITNLVLNAVSAFAAQGETEQIKRLEISAHVSRGRLDLKIIDNAGGIPKLIKQKLFFTPVTTKTDGHGYGLLLVKHQVEDVLNGSIICKSRLGEGTSFIIKLPCRP